MPTDLITVACCRRCNQAYSKIEEQLRVFVAVPINRSQDGDWIFKKKVVGSTFRRSPKLRKHFAKGIVTRKVDTPFGPAVLPLVTMKPRPVKKCLIKITKGLLAHFYPEIDRSDDNLKFEVTQFDQFKIGKEYMSQHPFIYDERGNGQFRFWRGLAAENQEYGIWILNFYDAAVFMVTHDSRHNPAAGRYRK